MIHGSIANIDSFSVDFLAQTPVISSYAKESMQDQGKIFLTRAPSSHALFLLALSVYLSSLGRKRIVFTILLRRDHTSFRVSLEHNLQRTTNLECPPFHTRNGSFLDPSSLSISLQDDTFPLSYIISASLREPAILTVIRTSSTFPASLYNIAFIQTHQ